MGFWEACKDFMLGRADPNIIYDGMPLHDRRKPEKRSAFIESMFKEYDAKLDIYINKIKSKTANTEDYAQRNKYITLYFLYKQGEGPLLENDKSLQDKVISSLFEWLHHTNSMTGETWVQALDELKTNDVVTSRLPKMFTAEFPAEWEVVRSRKAEAEKAAAARRKGLEEALSGLESELSRSKSMFYSMDSGMGKMQMTVRIDVLEQNIARIKSDLAEG